MPNFGEIKGLIARNLNRGDLSNDADAAISEDTISYYIKEAIKYYKSERLYFLEALNTSITLVDGQETSSIPSDFVEELIFRLTGPQARRLCRLNYIELEEYRSQPNQTTVDGIPLYFALYEELFHYWPKPNSNYDTSLSYIKELPELITDSDSNAWTEQASRLIVAKATADIYINRLKSSSRAGDFVSLAKDELNRLISLNNKRNTSHRLRTFYN